MKPYNKRISIKQMIDFAFSSLDTIGNPAVRSIKPNHRAGLTRDRMADHFDVGVRTIDRRLKSHHWTFTELKDLCTAVRLAELVTANPNIKINRAYQLLGYADHVSLLDFTHRKYGMTFKEYKNALAGTAPRAEESTA